MLLHLHDIAITRFNAYALIQEAYVREWARKRTGLDCNFNISFYPGRYAAEKGERGRGTDLHETLLWPGSGPKT